MGSGGSFPAMATRSSNPAYVGGTCGVGALVCMGVCRGVVGDFYACGFGGF